MNIYTTNSVSSIALRLRNLRGVVNISLGIFVLLLSCIPLLAQDGSSLPSEREKAKTNVQFNGLGRTILQSTALDGEITKTDSVTARRLSDGEFLLDVAVNATPSDNAEVQGILRLRNEFGGFFGSGVTVEVRELWARGVIGDAIGYRVGDFDYAMTPYTFWTPDEEGMVNEAALFAPQREVIYYEQFYTGDNTRRLQGAQLDFGLNFPFVINSMEADAFIARIRPTDFFTTPTRFVGGGRIDFSTAKLQDSLGLSVDFGVNFANTWDDLQSGNATSGIRNQVLTFDFDVSIVDKRNLGINLIGEAGMSNLVSKADSITVFEEDDGLVDVKVVVDLKPSNLRFSVGYLDVGPDFFSAAAQSRRINYTANKTFYNRLGNDRAFRLPSLFDITRDRALYNFQVSDRLMEYDPRYANVMPYGQATPNRTGLQIAAMYGDDESPLELTVNAAILSEIRGQGTFQLKDFTQIRAMANVNIHQALDWKQNFRLTLGLQQENTTRGGDEIEAIDLSSTLLEVGVEAELFPRFDLLLGGKFLTAEGSEYVPLVREFNDVFDFPERFQADDSESLIGAGLRYRFRDDVYLTIQYQQFNLEKALTPANDHSFEQFFAQYNMNF